MKFISFLKSLFASKKVEKDKVETSKKEVEKTPESGLEKPKRKYKPRKKTVEKTAESGLEKPKRKYKPRKKTNP
jgi:hypothetical protein